MTRFALREIAEATGALLWRGAPEAVVHGLSTDSRSIASGELFLALSGDHFDGNQFAAAAAARGAGALLLRAGDAAALAGLPEGVPVLLHEDPRRALGQLAHWHRRRLRCAVVGITGSAGKTTTKNMILALLAGERVAVGSEKSFNNDIGVPLTILRADESTQVLVVEIGTNAPGEIAALCRIAEPTIGVVTGIGHAHLEKLGSVEGVAREKSALPASLPANGLCVLNADARFLGLLRDATRARVLTCSVGGEGDLVASELVFHAAGASFRLGPIALSSPLLGTHNVSNLLLALAVCQGLGLDLERLLPKVAELRGGRQRLERKEIGGLTVIDDAYNANPESARAAVRVLAGMHGFKRRVFVFGDMLELGERAGELHHQLGQQVAASGIDLLVLVGELGRAAGAGACEGGFPEARIAHFANTEAAAAALPALLAPGDVVLLKASRRMAFERIVEALERAAGAREDGSSPRAGRGREVCLL